MAKLLTAAQFRKIRDQVALDSMTARLVVLEPLRDDLYRQYVGLRVMLDEATDRNLIDGLKYELYNRPSGEYGDKGGIAWQYQQAAAQVDDILRDARYRNHK